MIPCLQGLPQSFDGDGFVSVLAPFFTAGGYDPGGEVDEADSAFSPILVLAALSAGGKGLDPTLGKEIFVRVRNRKGVGRGGGALHDRNLNKSLLIRYGNGEGSSIMFERQH